MNHVSRQGVWRSAVALLLGLMLLLAACGSDDDGGSTAEPETDAATTTETNDEAPPTEDATDAELLDIAFIQTGSLDYYQSGVDGALAAADDLGVSIDVLNSEFDPATEIANVEDAIQKGADGIILFSASRSSEEAALQAAGDAGIPVAVLYGYDEALESEGVVFVQADVGVVGSMAGSWMSENISTGEVAMIQGALGRGDVEGYTEGWATAVETSGLEVVATLPADWDRAKAVAVMEDILSANPDLAGVWVNNEDMALGAIQAIDAAGKADQVTVVAMNGSPDGLAAIGDGSIAATVAWSPADEAQMALVRLVEYLRTGTESAPKLCQPPIILITGENLADASPWVPTEDSTAAALAAPCSN